MGPEEIGMILIIAKKKKSVHPHMKILKKIIFLTQMFLISALPLLSQKNQLQI